MMVKCLTTSNHGLVPFGISNANQELFFLYNYTVLSVPPPLAWAPVYSRYWRISVKEI